ncbi:YdbL family protein [Dongshaea marina]|uniref:YdbL family protein n=1 Tax=Dongshaea marina TaxID=2047966 RepID=UPI000D3E5DD0|nr:DUF1318 domain-containing protein [Dongshaea marina]
MKRLIILFSALLLSFSALALNLQQAKQQGLVGEQANGLLGVVKGGPGVGELVANVNAQRLQQYKKIARKSGASLQQVQDLAGQKTLKNASPGQYVQGSGGWRKK